MAVLADLISKVRTEINDQAKQFTKTFACDGSTTTFNLGYKPVDPGTLLVKDNSSTLTNPTGYTVESLYGVVHTTSAPTSGHTLTVSGNVWRYFSDDEITNFINVAVLQHTQNRTDAFGSLITISTLPEIEVYPLVVLCTVEALFALATDASYDIDIQAPDGVTIPRSERFRQLSALINQRMEHYKSICAALNIGLWRIEIGTLRRVSRTTNKLVPIYMPQEVDDASKPERVYMQNDLNGRTVIASTATILDLVMYEGDNFTQVITLPSTVDFTDIVFAAQIRAYPGSPTLWATFTTATVSASAKTLRISLTKTDTANLPLRTFWDIQGTSIANPANVTTYFRGQVFTTQQITE